MSRNREATLCVCGAQNCPDHKKPKNQQGPYCTCPNTHDLIPFGIWIGHRSLQIGYPETPATHYRTDELVCKNCGWEVRK